MIGKLVSSLIWIFALTVLFSALPILTEGHVQIYVVADCLAIAAVIVVAFQAVLTVGPRQPRTAADVAPLTEPVTDYHINHTVVDPSGEVLSRPLWQRGSA